MMSLWACHLLCAGANWKSESFLFHCPLDEEDYGGEGEHATV